MNFVNSAVVIGVGLNYRLTDNYVDLIGQPSTDLVNQGILESRSHVLRRSVEKLCEDFRTFTDGGFSVFRDDFNEIHWLANRLVEVSQVGITVTSGIVTGVNSEGELLVRNDDKEVPVITGEILLIDRQHGK